MLSLMILKKLKLKLLSVTDDGEAMTILSQFLERVTNRDSTVPKSETTKETSPKKVRLINKNEMK